MPELASPWKTSRATTPRSPPGLNARAPLAAATFERDDMTQPLLTALLVAACLCSCSPSPAVPGPGQERPHVASFQPGDVTDRLDQSVSLGFDREMVGV